MKYVLEIQRGLDGSASDIVQIDLKLKDEKVFSDRECRLALEAFYDAMRTKTGATLKVILWREYDCLSEAPSGLSYHIIQKEHRKVLRNIYATCQ